ncbi:MAG: hypothetical protein JWN39_2810, partial [Ilumatobacteraceae bacterium]|nr:hypothetical protein [Ilumatobacteraceae bacterium]
MIGAADGTPEAEPTAPSSRTSPGLTKRSSSVRRGVVGVALFCSAITSPFLENGLSNHLDGEQVTPVVTSPSVTTSTTALPTTTTSSIAPATTTTSAS